MASFSTNEFRGGMKIMLDNEPCVIIENEFVKPGKGRHSTALRSVSYFQARCLKRLSSLVSRLKLQT